MRFVYTIIILKHPIHPLSHNYYQDQFIMEDTTETLIQQATDVLEMIEDMVEYYCDQNMVSGEKIYSMIHELSYAKLEEFPNE